MESLCKAIYKAEIELDCNYGYHWKVYMVNKTTYKFGILASIKFESAKYYKNKITCKSI